MRKYIIFWVVFMAGCTQQQEPVLLEETLAMNKKQIQVVMDRRMDYLTLDEAELLTFPKRFQSSIAMYQYLQDLAFAIEELDEMQIDNIDSLKRFSHWVFNSLADDHNQEVTEQGRKAAYEILEHTEQFQADWMKNGKTRDQLLYKASIQLLKMLLLDAVKSQTPMRYLDPTPIFGFYGRMHVNTNLLDKKQEEPVIITLQYKNDHNWVEFGKAEVLYPKGRKVRSMAFENMALIEIDEPLVDKMTLSIPTKYQFSRHDTTITEDYIIEPHMLYRYVTDSMKQDKRAQDRYSMSIVGWVKMK